MNQQQDLDGQAHSAILSTERYYREQIFSSGCSSLVPIYRIAHSSKVEALLQQLEGSPYVQKDIVFSARVIEALIDVNLYQLNGKHFFFHGDMPPEVQSYVEQNCTKIESFSQVVQSDEVSTPPEWCDFDADIPKLIDKYPILQKLDIPKLSNQLIDAISHVSVPSTIRTHLELFHKPEWERRLEQNQSALFYMLEVANRLSLNEQEMTDLVMLGIVKDLGYTRLSDQMDNFEILHPLVTHELVQEANTQASDSERLGDDLLGAVIVQHEFADFTGPLARMRHPVVMKQLESGMPKVAQISGMCDLYFGFLKDYGTTLSFAITCGFVMGQGKVPPRYSHEVIETFSEIFGSGSADHVDVPMEESNEIVQSVLATLKDVNVRNNAGKVIQLKTETGYERITLALNIVRNIARNQPAQMSETSLVNVLNLPEEFGLNY